MKKIRTAVVGLKMGLGHAKAYAASERSELTYVVDLNEELASKVAADLGCKYATDWESIMDEVDAISFATPHHLHYPQAMKAIAAGKHVLIEKPLANTEEQCLEMISAAKEKDVRLMIAYVVRYLPAVRKMKELLDSGEYGQPINVSGFVQAYLEPVPGSWFSKKETLGGGVLFSHGCHYIDILLYFFGDPDRVAQLGTRVGTDWMEGEGTSQAIMLFKNGVVANVNSSWGLRSTRPPARYQIHTTKGMLQLNNDMWTIEWTSREDGTKVVYARPEDAKPNVEYEIEHFLENIENGTTPETDGVDALRSHRTIWAMYESEGVPVKL